MYSHTTPFTFFFGIPVRGGDYNEGPVRCWVRFESYFFIVRFEKYQQHFFSHLPFHRDVEIATEALAFLVTQITANFDATIIDISSLEIEEPHSF